MSILPNSSFFSFRGCRAALFLLLAAAGLQAQLSPSAYRALGQSDLRFNGLNMVDSHGLSSPSAVAVDSRGGQLHVYISDSRNDRILAWADASSYQIGDPPALVLGQPNPQSSGVLEIGPKGLNDPRGLAVDAATGNLFVADTGDNRVLRFPSPFANPARIEPDMVYGQPNFASLSAGAVSATSLSHPGAVAVDSGGNLWVADTGNNRVVRFNASSLNANGPAEDVVIGQKDFSSNAANRGATVSAGTLAAPAGLAFDTQDNLYVSDSGNSRVLKFNAPAGAAPSGILASAVWGQLSLNTRGVPTQPSGFTLNGPAGLSVDVNGNLFVAVPNDNRVLVFRDDTSGSAATAVFGQVGFNSAKPNAGSAPFASATTLASPFDVKTAPDGTVFIADTGNNRVLEFPGGSQTATVVFGQPNLTLAGANQVKATSINAPYSMAIDYSQSPFPLYVSDYGNNRILVWKDSAHFLTGAPADLEIGQPDFTTAIPNVDTSAPSATSLSSPAGIAVNQTDGTLYVADSGNNRVLRFPRPVDQSGRIQPDAVIGEPDFTTSTSAAVSASSLHSPTGLSLAPNGDLFVADSGNNRVLEFPAGSGNMASAVRIFGQPDSTSSARSAQVSAQTLSGPGGIFVDSSFNLFVADTAANRVVVFTNTQAAPSASASAAYVIGQPSFSTSAPGSAGNGLKAPSGVGVDSNGIIYVADTGNNRVAIYSSLVTLLSAGSMPTGVIGQKNTSGSNPNFNSPGALGTPQGLSGPVGLYVDRRDTLYVGDTGNNRVLQFLKPAVVVNAATYQAGAAAAQGGLATLFSVGLTTEIPMQATGATWPFVLLNRQVQVNDQLSAPLYYVGGNQVNFQVPSGSPVGPQRIAVRVGDTGELIAGGTMLVGSASPGLFALNLKGSGQGAVLNQDGSVNGPANPALKGSTVSIYATGQGQVSPAVPDGTAAPFAPLSYTVASPTTDGATCLNTQPSVCAAIGTNFGAIQFSGLAPGYIGLWQINVMVPPNTPTSNAVAVRVVIDGVPSNIVTIAVH